MCITNIFVLAISQQKQKRIPENKFSFYILVETSEMNQNKTERYKTYIFNRRAIYHSRPYKYIKVKIYSYKLYFFFIKINENFC